MGIKEIHRNNLRDIDNETYRYILNVGDIEQSLYITNLTDPLFKNFNYFQYYNGSNLRLHLTNTVKNLEIVNGKNKIIIINNNKIKDIRTNYKSEIEMYQDQLRFDLGEELILTDDSKRIKSIREKHFLYNKMIDRYYDYDDKNRLISVIEDKYGSEYRYSRIYEYDNNDRVTRIVRKILSNIMTDEIIEYIEIPDQDVINEFTRFFNLLGINRESLINELNIMDISLYDNVEIEDLRSVING